MSENNNLTGKVSVEDDTQSKIEAVESLTETLDENLAKINVDSDEYIEPQEPTINIDTANNEEITLEGDTDADKLQNLPSEVLGSREHQDIAVDVPPPNVQTDEEKIQRLEDYIMAELSKKLSLAPEEMKSGITGFYFDERSNVRDLDDEIDVGYLDDITIEEANELGIQRRKEAERRRISKMINETAREIMPFLGIDVNEDDMEQPTVSDIMHSVMADTTSKSEYQYDIRGLKYNSLDYKEARSGLLYNEQFSDLTNPESVNELTEFLETQFPYSFNEGEMIIPKIEQRETSGIDAVLSNPNLTQKQKDEFKEKLENTAFNREIIDASVYVDEETNDIEFAKTPIGTAQREYIKGLRNSFQLTSRAVGELHELQFDGDDFDFDLSPSELEEDDKLDDVINDISPSELEEFDELDDMINNLMQFNDDLIEEQKNMDTGDLSDFRRMADEVHMNLFHDFGDEFDDLSSQEEQDTAIEKLEFSGEVRATKETTVNLTPSSINDFISEHKLTDIDEE